MTRTRRQVQGFAVRVHVRVCSSETWAGSSRRLQLAVLDGIVFVAESAPERTPARAARAGAEGQAQRR